jgi:hypothetical protein
MSAWPLGWKCSGPYGDDRESSSKLGEDLGKAKYIKLTDDEKLLDAQTFNQICATGASDSQLFARQRRVILSELRCGLH